ncbi:MAG: NFACT RNA binding domain-containing protein [Clostridia bacterium]|nr:NFACT RNA binding domain-containing protein [Clostridia bacterium]
MALDSIAVSALIKELNAALIDGRIDKIHQPERDELTVSVRTFSDSFKLVISASPSNARVHFTDTGKENPKTAPMFCMLLRKHIQGGKIISVSQPDFERIIDITVQTRNELGDIVLRHLIVELTGRNANIILTDENSRIIEAARHIDFTQSSVRQILPGLTYLSPPPQNKIPFLDSKRDFDLSFDDITITAQSALMAEMSGISPIFAREVIYRVTNRTDTMASTLSIDDKNQIITLLNHYRLKASNGEFSPVVITEKETGRIIDFSPFDISQYESACEITSFSKMADAIECFYSTRASKERLKQRSADLLKLVNSNLERLSKKLIIQQKTLKDAENKEKYRRFGDLITSSLYMIKPGMTEAQVPDYFESDAPTVKIPLSPQLSPAENAQKYYKRYTKAKNAEIEVNKQLESTLTETEYLQSTLSFIENCTTLSDINAIRLELLQEGYIKSHTNNRKKQKESGSIPYHFISSDGFDIYVGKNNLQNDLLTLKFANNQDIWFHTKKIHGSHTVIKLGLDKQVPKNTLIEAAQLAAYYSKARESGQVPVDYTTIKNVKKPNGAKPGMVIYDNYNTIYATPKSPEELNLKMMDK